MWLTFCECELCLWSQRVVKGSHLGFKRIGSLLARDVSGTTFGCTTAYYIVIIIRGGTDKTDMGEDGYDDTFQTVKTQLL